MIRLLIAKMAVMNSVMTNATNHKEKKKSSLEGARKMQRSVCQSLNTVILCMIVRWEVMKSIAPVMRGI